MSLVRAAIELVEYVEREHNIESLDSFTCPYMRALADAAWSLREEDIKRLEEYERLVLNMTGGDRK